MNAHICRAEGRAVVVPPVPYLLSDSVHLAEKVVHGVSLTVMGGRHGGL